MSPEVICVPMARRWGFNRDQTVPPFVLTLDIGTSSTRALLFDRQARIVEGTLSQKSHQLLIGPDGRAELDPMDILNGVVSVIDQTLARAGSLVDQIVGVGMATLVTNIMGLDKIGQPLTPVFTYADTRTHSEVIRLASEMGDVQQRTGCPLHTAYLPAYFHWLTQNQPGIFDKVAAWVSLGEYLWQEFFGRRWVGYSVASWSGLLNRHSLDWDAAWLSTLPLLKESHFSPLADISRSIRGLKKKWADRWPALKNIPWFPAVGDGAAANLGTGCDTPDQMALTIGTTGAVRMVLKAEDISTIPKSLWLYRLDRERALLGGATTEGGNVFAWLRQTLQLPSSEQIELELARLKPTDHGLTLLPFWGGERAPGWCSEARATILGLTFQTQPLEILQAALEAIAYRLALIYQQMLPFLSPTHQIVASGQALLSSPAWLQMMADVLGQPVFASDVPEATSRGVALLALENLDLLEEESSLEEESFLEVEGHLYQPDQDHHFLHQQAIQKQVSAYNQVTNSL